MESVILGKCVKSGITGKKFNIVVPAYNPGNMLDVIINCFLSQTSDDWDMTIVFDGYDEKLDEIVERYSEYNNLSFHVLECRWNDWGHTPREYGLHLSDSEYTILTGYDNYYVPTFIEEFKKAVMITSDVDMVFCNFLLNHIREGIPYNKYIDSKLEVNFIDIGNFAAKTSLLKEVGFKWRNYAADWELVKALGDKIREMGTKIVKIPQTLYVHN